MKKAMTVASLTLVMSFWAQAQSSQSIECVNQDFHVKVVVSDIQPFSTAGGEGMVDLTSGVVTITRDGHLEESVRTVGPRSSTFESYRNDKGIGIDIKTDEYGRPTGDLKSKNFNLKKLECTDHRDPALMTSSQPARAQSVNSSKGAR